MGNHNAAISLSNYYESNGYDLPPGKVTQEEANLQEAIKYEEMALKIIRSQDNYPFDDLHGDDFRIEQEDHIYLKTASNVTVSYLSQFIAKINDHLKSTNKDINGITMTFLGQAINAADNCLAIPPNKDVWDDSVYDKYMAQCHENKRIAQALGLV